MGKRPPIDPKWIPLIDFCWQERQDTSIPIHQPADPEVFRQSMEFVGYAANARARVPVAILVVITSTMALHTRLPTPGLSVRCSQITLAGHTSILIDADATVESF